MATRKTAAQKRAEAATTDPVAAKDAPSTTEESDAQVAKSVEAVGDTAAGTTEMFDKANELGYIGTVSEEAIRNAEYADLSNDAGYMGGPPKGEIVAE